MTTWMKEPARLCDTVSAHSSSNSKAQSIPRLLQVSLLLLLAVSKLALGAIIKFRETVYLLQLRLFRWVFLIVLDGKVNGLVQILRAWSILGIEWIAGSSDPVASKSIQWRSPEAHGFVILYPRVPLPA